MREQERAFVVAFEGLRLNVVLQVRGEGVVLRERLQYHHAAQIVGDDPSLDARLADARMIRVPTRLL
jgi:hypothetical protein